jgi:hypothetical protein
MIKIMKTKILLSLFAVGVLVFNTLISNVDHNSKRDVLLKNIIIMQANAIEAKCDGRNQNECYFEVILDGQLYVNYSVGWFVVTP